MPSHDFWTSPTIEVPDPVFDTELQRDSHVPRRLEANKRCSVKFNIS